MHSFFVQVCFILKRAKSGPSIGRSDPTVHLHKRLGLAQIGSMPTMADSTHFVNGPALTEPNLTRLNSLPTPNTY